MAIAKTKIDEDVWGKTKVITFDIVLDTSYPTGGYGVALAFGSFFGVGKAILGVNVIALIGAAAGVAFLHFDQVAQKLMAFRVGTFTPAGSVVGNVTVVGGALGEAIGINPDTNAGVLSKAAATNRTIPIATFLGAAPTISGTAQGQVAFAEVSNAVNLSAVGARVQVFGRA